jgi:hypothetical protein
MNNIKFTVVFSVCGFLLSFVSGLFSRAGFGIVFLHALLFGVLFCILSFGILYVYKKFLTDDTGSPAAEPAGEKKTGGMVDITIQDEDLPNEENAPQFFVGSNHLMLKKNDYSSLSENSGTEKDVLPVQNPVAGSEDNRTAEKQKNDNTEDTKAAGFIPVALQESAQNLTGTESMAAVTSEKNMVSESPDGETVVQGDEDLDELPDMEDLQTDENNNPDLVEDSDFSQERGNKESGTTGEKDIKDVALMAKAVSTLLSKDAD